MDDDARPVDATEHDATTCTCIAARRTRHGVTLVLGWALLASTAAPFVFTGAPGNFIGIMAGAYLIQSWHDAAPPAKEDWWRRGRTWVHALGIAVAVTVAFLLT